MDKANKDFSHTQLSGEECVRLLRLLEWVGVACQSTHEDKELLQKIQYKLRARLKEDV